MAADYTKFKTPFYEIEVADPSFKRKVKLPHHILRLVERIEIVECFATAEQMDGADVLRISFIEGSREPASQDPSMGTSGLYKMSIDGTSTDLDIAGSLTNRVGSIVDLRFSGNSGITFLTEGEKKLGKIDNKVQENVDGKKITRKHKGEKAAPKFLFEYMNKLKVTWGYIEDPQTVRSKVFNIISIETIFSDTGPNMVNIMGSDLGAPSNQIAAKIPKTFGTVKKFKGDFFVDFQDLKTDELIRKIAADAGMATIISKNLPSETLDKSKQKMWIAGESFHEFMTRLAATHNSYYKLVNDPKTGKATIIFIKKTDFEARSVIPDIGMLTYKGPGTLIKTVSVNAEWHSPSGQTTAGTDDSGDPVGVSDDVSVDMVQFKGNKEQAVQGDPTKDPGLGGLVDGVLEGDYTGKLEVSPNQSVDYHKGLAKTGADNSSRQVSITVNTIGYTKLTPGVLDIKGIGVRYSGKYRIISVEHTIDASNGYTCKLNGMTHSLPNGGTQVPETDPGQDKPEEQVKLQQFASVRDELDKFQGTV